MSRDTTQGYKIETYMEQDIYVDASGTFFVKDDARHRQVEAKSLQAIREKLRKPIQEVKAKGLIFHFYRDDDDPTVIDVYGISGLGNILYTHGKTISGAPQKERTSRGEPVYVYDTKLLARRKELINTKAAAEKALEKLMEEWPKIERKNEEPQ